MCSCCAISRLDLPSASAADTLLVAVAARLAQDLDQLGRLDQRAAVRQRAYRGEDLGHAGRLLRHTGCTGIERRRNLGPARARGEHQHAAVWHTVSQGGDDVHPGSVGQAQIDHGDRPGGIARECLSHAAGLGDDVEIGLARQHERQRLPERIVVVDEQQIDHGA